MTILEPYRQFSDARGRMIGVINEGQWEEINFVETARGTVRGGHFHRQTRELFLTLSGHIRVRVVAEESESIHEFGPGVVFVVEPGEAHWFEALTDCTWINVLSRRMDPASPDIVQVPAAPPPA